MFSQASKPKPFAYYLKQMRADDSHDHGSGALLGLMRELQAKGMPVQIKRLDQRPRDAERQ